MSGRRPAGRLRGAIGCGRGLTLWIGVRCSLTHLLQLLLCPLQPLLHLEHLDTDGASEETTLSQSQVSMGRDILTLTEKAPFLSGPTELLKAARQVLRKLSHNCKHTSTCVPVLWYFRIGTSVTIYSKPPSLNQHHYSWLFEPYPADCET